MTTLASSIADPVQAADPVSAWLPLAGRITMATLFLLSGAGKLAAPAATVASIGPAGLPVPPLAFAVALAVELIGGVFILAGYRTRIAAGVLAVFTIATAVGFHTDFADQNQLIHFFKDLAIAGGLAQLAAFGPGRISLDRR